MRPDHCNFKQKYSSSSSRKNLNSVFGFPYCFWMAVPFPEVCYELYPKMEIWKKSNWFVKCSIWCVRFHFFFLTLSHSDSKAVNIEIFRWQRSFFYFDGSLFYEYLSSPLWVMVSMFILSNIRSITRTRRGCMVVTCGLSARAWTPCCSRTERPCWTWSRR